MTAADLVVHDADLVHDTTVATGRSATDWVAITDGVIVAVGDGNGWATHRGGQTEVFDAAGRVVSAGLVDIHVHGSGGFVHDDGADAIRGALDCHRRHGTTRSVLSLVSNSIEQLCASLHAIGQVMSTDPTVLGAHLEGPFLSPARRGAHAEASLVHPTPERVESLLAAGDGIIRQVTLAPELPGADDAIARFVDAGVTVAIGHTDADFDTARRAFDLGATVLTHAYNCMPPIHHRAPGPVLAAFADDRVSLELIVDGVHLHPRIVATTFAAAPGRVVLVSDAVSAACCGDGDHHLGSLAVTVRDGRATIATKAGEVLAGSTITLDRAVRSAILDCDVDPVAAIIAATTTPARAVGVDDRFGTIAPGRAADLVCYGADWSVEAVWVNGRRPR